MRSKRIFALLLAFILLCCALCSCGAPDASPEEPNTPVEVISEPEAETSGNYIIRLTGDLPDGEKELDLEALEQDFSGPYSVINNWPSKKFAAAEGVTVKSILEAAGALDTFQQITVTSTDGYCMSFTRDQVLVDRWYYPGLMEDDTSNAAKAPMILALRYTTDGADAVPEAVKTTLVFGQEDIFEHNTPAFVEDVAEICISNEDPGQWEPATSFPAPGEIAAGELVKLQHNYAGLAKLYYTTDGSAPTYERAMYNPSTYQPEVNVPIEVTEDTVIKVIVRGYGHNDSDIAELAFTVNG